MRKRVSALMPVHNGEDWILEALKNVNKTLNEDDELVIVDDGSTDGTVSLIEIANIVPHSLLKLPKVGLVKALNSGLHISINDWIVRFDVDDHYEMNRINVLLEGVRENTVAVFSDYEFRSAANQIFGRVFSPILDGAVRLSLFRSQRTAHPSVIYKKSAVIKAGGYLVEDFPCEDLSLWFRLAEYGEFESRDSVLLHYTLRNDSISATKFDAITMKRNFLVETYSKTGFAKNAVTCLGETLEQYENYTCSTERKLLHLFDFFEKNFWIGLSLEEKLKVLSFALVETLHFRSWQSATKLLIERRRRSKFRKRNYQV